MCKLPLPLFPALLHFPGGLFPEYIFSCCRFKNTACMMHMGNMTKDFVPVGKEEQAEIKNEDNSEKVAALLGIGE